MLIGIKYCGGCNPQFNRRELVENLIDKSKDDLFQPAEKGTYYNLVLVINGCMRACAGYQHFNGKGKLFINSQEDFKKVIDIINDLKNI